MQRQMRGGNENIQHTRHISSFSWLTRGASLDADLLCKQQSTCEQRTVHENPVKDQNTDMQSAMVR